MATHSSVLATQGWGCTESDKTEVTQQQQQGWTQLGRRKEAGPAEWVLSMSILPWHRLHMELSK